MLQATNSKDRNTEKTTNWRKTMLCKATSKSLDREAADLVAIACREAPTETAARGPNYNRQQFFVVVGMFLLLWATPPLGERALIDPLYDLFATALALASMSCHTGA